ncbi:MAG TPA: hypothetical protein VI461_08310 [Chitinophagaceae bacterium]|nr:hypothetical protein [Chitinophagaceae bacterium]
MLVIPIKEFIQRTLGGRPNKMDTTYYIGRSYECGCGEVHKFNQEHFRILRELPKMRLVVSSEQCSYVTCIKVKGIFWFKGFESLFSAKDQT